MFASRYETKKIYNAEEVVRFLLQQIYGRTDYTNQWAATETIAFFDELAKSLTMLLKDLESVHNSEQATITFFEFKFIFAKILDELYKEARASSEAYGSGIASPETSLAFFTALRTLLKL